MHIRRVRIDGDGTLQEVNRFGVIVAIKEDLCEPVAGIEGLLPISEISYGRVEDVNEILSSGIEDEGSQFGVDGARGS